MPIGIAFVDFLRTIQHQFRALRVSQVCRKYILSSRQYAGGKGFLFFAIASQDESSRRVQLAQPWLDEDTFTLISQGRMLHYFSGIEQTERKSVFDNSYWSTTNRSVKRCRTTETLRAAFKAASWLERRFTGSRFGLRDYQRTSMNALDYLCQSRVPLVRLCNAVENGLGAPLEFSTTRRSWAAGRLQQSSSRPKAPSPYDQVRLTAGSRSPVPQRQRPTAACIVSD